VTIGSLRGNGALCVALIARIYEVFPRVCPTYGGNMRLIAFITEGGF